MSSHNYYEAVTGPAGIVGQCCKPVLNADRCYIRILPPGPIAIAVAYDHAVLTECRTCAYLPSFWRRYLEEREFLSAIA